MSSNENKVIPEAQAIHLNLNRSTFLIFCWMLAITFLIITVMFRQMDAPRFKAATIDAQKIVNQGRGFISAEARYPEFVEVEVVEFVKHVQLELDILSADPDISMVMTMSSVLSGNAVDYTDYIYLHALESYKDSLKERVSMTGTPDSGLSPVVMGAVN